MLSGLLKMSGFLIMYLVYGKEEYHKRWDPSEFTIMIQCGLSFGVIIWLLCLLSLPIDMAIESKVFCIVYFAAFPLALVIWTIFVRRRARKERGNGKDEQR